MMGTDDMEELFTPTANKVVIDRINTTEEKLEGPSILKGGQVRVGLRFPTELYKQMVVVSKREARSLSSLIRIMLMEGIERRNKSGMDR